MLPGKGRLAFIAGFALLFFICLMSAPALAKDDWPAPSPEELAMKDNPASPGAHAMILYRESISDDKDSFETYYYRIKIFTEAGKKYADIEIPFFHGTGSVKDIRARTVHPDGKIMEWDGKVYEKLLVKAGGVKLQAKTFTLPEVQPGSIIEYKYRLQFDSLKLYNTHWNVQEDLFTRRAVFSLRPFIGDTAPGLYWRSFKLPQGTEPQKQKDSSMRLEVKDVAGLEEEENMPPASEERGRLEFFYRQNSKETMEEFWKRIIKGRADYSENFIGKRGAIKQTVDQTVAAGDSPEVKLQKLYARTQQIHNFALDVGKTEKEEKREKLKDNNNVEDVLKHGYGSPQDINRFFVALARAAGFEADWVNIAPRNRNFFHPEPAGHHPTGSRHRRGGPRLGKSVSRSGLQLLPVWFSSLVRDRRGRRSHQQTGRGVCQHNHAEKLGCPGGTQAGCSPGGRREAGGKMDRELPRPICLGTS